MIKNNQLINSYRQGKMSWMWLSVIWVVVIGVVLVNLQMPIHHDEAVFLTIGRELNQGKTLYLDIFDHKPPGIHLLSQLVMVSSGEVTAARLLTLGVVIMSGFWLYLILKKRSSKIAAGMGVGIFLIVNSWWHGGYFLAEPFVVSLFLGAYWLSEKSESLNLGRYVLIGILAGLMLWFKQTGILLLLILGLKIWVDHKNFQGLRAFVVGVTIPIVFLLMWLVMKNNLSEALDSMVWFNLFDYNPEDISATIWSLPKIIWPVVLLVGMSLMNLKENKNGFMLVMGMILLLPMLLTRPYHHYWLLLLPLLILEFSSTLKQTHKNTKLALVNVMMAGVVFVISSGVNGAKDRGEQISYWSGVSSCEKVDHPVGYLLTGCKAGKYFFVPANVNMNLLLANDNSRVGEPFP